MIPSLGHHFHQTNSIIGSRTPEPVIFSLAGTHSLTKKMVKLSGFHERFGYVASATCRAARASWPPVRRRLVAAETRTFTIRLQAGSGYNEKSLGLSFYAEVVGDVRWM